MFKYDSWSAISTWSSAINRGTCCVWLKCLQITSLYFILSIVKCPRREFSDSEQKGELFFFQFEIDTHFSHLWYKADTGWVNYCPLLITVSIEINKIDLIGQLFLSIFYSFARSNKLMGLVLVFECIERIIFVGEKNWHKKLRITHCHSRKSIHVHSVIVFWTAQSLQLRKDIVFDEKVFVFNFKTICCRMEY